MKFAKVVVNELHAICMPLSLNDSTVLSSQVTRVLYVASRVMPYMLAIRIPLHSSIHIINLVIFPFF